MHCRELKLREYLQSPCVLSFVDLGSRRRAVRGGQPAVDQYCLSLEQGFLDMKVICLYR